MFQQADRFDPSCQPTWDVRAFQPLVQTLDDEASAHALTRERFHTTLSPGPLAHFPAGAVAGAYYHSYHQSLAEAPWTALVGASIWPPPPR